MKWVPTNPGPRMRHPVYKSRDRCPTAAVETFSLLAFCVSPVGIGKMEASPTRTVGRIGPDHVIHGCSRRASTGSLAGSHQVRAPPTTEVLLALLCTAEELPSRARGKQSKTPAWRTGCREIPERIKLGEETERGNLDPLRNPTLQGGVKMAPKSPRAAPD